MPLQVCRAINRHVQLLDDPLHDNGDRSGYRGVECVAYSHRGYFDAKDPHSRRQDAERLCQLQ